MSKQRKVAVVIALVLIVAVAAATWIGTIVRPELRRLQRAAASRVRVDLDALAMATEDFYVDHLRWPESTSELVARGVHGYSYLKQAKEPLDPWQRPYVMQCLADHEIRIGTFGRDGEPGGDGDDADHWCSDFAASAR